MTTQESVSQESIDQEPISQKVENPLLHLHQRVFLYLLNTCHSPSCMCVGRLPATLTI
ncbi:Uncharacterised protein [Yersinia thracica]|uniref:Uncharacterized protein n=1 Tax=Yersinia thracica TaxID=2890319 RepID=A0A0T9P4Y5_9GAMM|nr:Uncharacterised protein [Yersinia thracica]